MVGVQVQVSLMYFFFMVSYTDGMNTQVQTGVYAASFPELRNEIIPRSRELYRRFGATLNKTEMCWTFPREDQFGTGTSTKFGPNESGIDDLSRTL